MTRRTPVVTGVGLAVSGLSDAAELFAPHRDCCAAALDLSGRQMRNKDRASRLALLAAERALADAATPSAGRMTADDAITATVVSSNYGNLDSVCDIAERITQHSSAALSPLSLPHVSSNAIAGWIAIRHDLRGPNITLCSGRTSGLDALHWAAILIRAGRADAAVVVGVEPDTAPVRALLDLGPGDKVLDGAAAVIVEADTRAERRGAPVRAVLGHYSRTTHVHDDPRPPGLWLAPPTVRPHSGSPTAVLDLTARLGECSGALGVLQCIAAATFFDGGDPGSAYAVCGANDSDVATLWLHPPRWNKGETAFVTSELEEP
ncbi:MAG: 3-oxoacyl-ACP synthase [Mycobacteriaceae bacterium]|nr:3-oxoacyl-ACP synthase [Mycobacteriaceae bacterium]